MYEIRKDYYYYYFFEKEGMGEKEIEIEIERWSYRQRVMKDEERK